MPKLKNLRQFFSYMNDIDFPYVVLRNWDNLPDKVEYGIHSDLDLLVYDLDHFKELFGSSLEPEYPLPRVRHKLNMDCGQIYLDARYLGDGYYPSEFEDNILKTRWYDKRGFYTPNQPHHRIGLAYHAVHHKGKNTYPRQLGELKINELLQALKQTDIGWTRPDDPTVGDFNAYQKGATSVINSENGIIRKKQTRFKEVDLIKNEAAMLSLFDNKHIPKLLRYDGDIIEVEECGNQISQDNLPEDWESQLKDIIRLLKDRGVVHRDIRKDNLLVKDKTVKLIDFGWARRADQPDGKTPNLLGFPNKPTWGFDDAFSMGKVIKQIKWELKPLYANLGS